MTMRSAIFIPLLLLTSAYADLSVSSPLPIQSFAPTKASYTATANAWTIPATPGDMFSIAGSASKTVKVQILKLTATQTTAASQTFFIVKRSTADTAGTSVASTIVPLDSTNAAATAVSKHWTANPTAGTSVGNVEVLRVRVPTATDLDLRWPIVINFTNAGLTQGVVLRGTAQELHVNFNGVALPAGLSVTGTWYWTEE